MTLKTRSFAVSLTGNLESVGRELEKENARGVVILNYSDYQSKPENRLG
ncbi:MAG: hypothetical protein U5L09_15370 [Bacteroidales bacterium]|nr:hypothetical protein [Bacteroidales bacterium]